MDVTLLENCVNEKENVIFYLVNLLKFVFWSVRDDWELEVNFFW